MSKEQCKEQIIGLFEKLLELYDKTSEPGLKIQIAYCILEFYKESFN